MIKQIQQFLRRQKWRTVQHAMAVRTDDGQLVESENRFLSERVDWRSVMTLGEAFADLAVRLEEVETAGLTLQAPSFGQHKALFLTDCLCVPLDSMMYPQFSLSFPKLFFGVDLQSWFRSLSRIAWRRYRLRDL